MKRMMFAAGAALLTFALTQASAEADTYGKLKSGKAAFAQECGKCHSTKYAQDVTYSRDEWEITVAMMRSNGAEFTDEQKLVIIDYLTAKSLLETKCSVCHAVDRPLSKAKSVDDWKATVTRMSGKKSGHLSEEDIAQIAAFLAVERPAQ